MFYALKFIYMKHADMRQAGDYIIRVDISLYNVLVINHNQRGYYIVLSIVFFWDWKLFLETCYLKAHNIKMVYKYLLCNFITRFFNF